MEKIKLLMPSLRMKEEIVDFKKEFEQNDEHTAGAGMMDNYDSFEEWMNAVKLNSRADTVMEGFVPATVFLAVKESDNKLVGMIDIRHYLNENLEKYNGHIGYCVRKSERRKGYAKEMLRLALEECKKMNIRKVLITCDKENIASEKTILANGGVFENELRGDNVFLEADKVRKRYFINL